MKIVVIGGTGHIGTYLCPMLTEDGHEVICVSRGLNKPYDERMSWDRVSMLQLDRLSMPREVFAEKMADLSAEIVIDLINFKLDDVQAMAKALSGKVEHYIYCSSCWAEGRAEILPVNPDNNDKHPLCEYGRQKHASEQYLLNEWRKHGFPVTIIMPGQISGPGWEIINPWGCRLMRCNEIIKSGGKLCLPNFGMETIHHVHAEDVARLFACAVKSRENALGEKFYAVSGQSITLYGYANLLYKFYGKTPDIEFLSWMEWQVYIKTECKGKYPDGVVEQQLVESYLHLTRSGYFSIDKESRLLGYKPLHTNVETIIESVKAYNL